jgi:hypothetical protein
MLVLASHPGAHAKLRKRSCSVGAPCACTALTGTAPSSAPLVIGGLLARRLFAASRSARGAWPLVLGGQDEAMAPLITVQCGPDDKPAKDTGWTANWDSNTVLVYPAKFYSRTQGFAYREIRLFRSNFSQAVPKKPSWPVLGQGGEPRTFG